MAVLRMGNRLILCLHFALLLVCYLSAVVSSAFTPTDNYLIDCGSSSAVTIDGRSFSSDSDSSSMLSTGQQISISTGNANVPSSLYLTARVFTATSSYTFSIKQQGRHWVRLYFYPIPHDTYDLKSAVFTVSTDKFVLLQDFSVKSEGNGTYVFKEYLINVTAMSMKLSFAPAGDSVAFINAIEVVSVPDDLLSNVPQTLSPVSEFPLNQYALETAYRLNVGGAVLTPKNDTLARTWVPDEGYLASSNLAQNASVPASMIKYPSTVSKNIAPATVYSTAETMPDANVSNANFNITWVLPLNPNFSYFVRFHFCDIVSTSLNTLYFNVYINTEAAITNLDLSTKTQNLNTPYYADFVTNTSGSNITVSVGPSTLQDVDPQAILNGLEVMKLSNDAGSLDGLYSVTGKVADSKGSSKLGAILGAVFGVIGGVAVLGLCYYCYCRPRSKENLSYSPWLPLNLYGGNSYSMGSKVSTVSHKSGAGSHASSGASNLGRYFTFAEIQQATNKFDESLLLGVGGFGKVYEGQLENGTKVAVKRGNPRSEQGLTEFQTEIEMLSKLRHRHLVSLIGYCEEQSEMILVYECMANGTLRGHLYGSNLPALSWKQRLEICIGSARGLHYLHTGAAQSIIHRDVKTTNILLDENLVAKVADFGLSKTGPSLDQTHVSTAVKGSFGYLDPEYFRRQQLTDKSDVYSFGVVLLEVLCARPALNPVLPREQVNLAEWAMDWFRKGTLEKIIDPHLANTINPGSLKKYGETAAKCLEEYGADRPAMGDVLWNLEYALQLQETAMQNEPDENSTNHIAEIPLHFPPSEPFDSRITEKEGDDDLEDATTSAVFSQLVNPTGR